MHRILAAASISLILSSAVVADERIGAFLLPDDAPNAIMLAGDITELAPLDFKKAMLRRPDADLLVLGSDGGSMLSGLLLADDVHVRKLATYIPEGLSCYSACSYVFLAGTQRLAAGELGVHQFYDPSSGGSDSSAQSVVADMLQIMDRFGVSQTVIGAMLRTPPDDIHVFSPKEIAENEIDLNADEVRLRSADIDAIDDDVLLAAVEEGSRPAEESIVAEETPRDRGATTPSTRTRQSVPAFAIYDDVDFYGSDVDKVAVDNIGQCVDACFEEDMCMALTFNTTTRKSRGPNCFLKDGIGEAVAFDGAISGIFTNTSMDMDLRIGRKLVSPSEVITAED